MIYLEPPQEVKNPDAITVNLTFMNKITKKHPSIEAIDTFDIYFYNEGEASNWQFATANLRDIYFEHIIKIIQVTDLKLAKAWSDG